MLTMLMTGALALLGAQDQPDLSWMAGYWLDCSRGEVSETWSDPRGGLMVGHNLTTRAGRTGFEVSRIAPHDGGLAYFAQPEGAPATAFPLKESAPRRAVFENLENDFPHRIIYAREGEVMTARIEGGGPTIDWRFQRAELNARCPL
jgi:hypothetical protein